MAINKETKNTNIGKLGWRIDENLKLFEGKIIEETSDGFLVKELLNGGLCPVSIKKFKIDNNIDDE